MMKCSIDQQSKEAGLHPPKLVKWGQKIKKCLKYSQFLYSV